MALIGWGITLLVIGLLLCLSAFFGMPGIMETLGWILLAIGLVLAIVHAVSSAGQRGHVH